MKFILTALTVFFLTTVSVSAQSAEDSVKATINNLFTAMKNADKVLFKTVFSDGAILQTIGRDKEGKTLVTSESIQEFGEFVGKLKKDSADERISFETIKIDGPLAIAWTPYNFYFNGKFSHCGVNSFQLVRLNDEWKIQYIIDTRRRTGCKQ
ncbi:MAG: hypothetical protein ACXWWA_13330 [Chitinophagaceae bacterium]